MSTASAAPAATALDGIAITLCDPAESSKLRQVERIIRSKLPIVADHLGSPDPQRNPAEKNERFEPAKDRADHNGRRDGRRPGGNNGFGKKRFGDKPAGDRPFAAKPQGERPEGRQAVQGQQQAPFRRQAARGAGCLIGQAGQLSSPGLIADDWN